MITFEDVINKSATMQNGCVVYLYTPKIDVMYNGKSMYFMEALAKSIGKEYQGVCYRSCFTKDCINPKHMIWTKEEKFWSNVEIKEDCDACWEWKCVAGKEKYAITGWNGKEEAVHRIAYRLSFSDFPRELQVCHKCDNPSCCNPNHLFLGTFQDNVDDRERKGRNKMPRCLGEKHGGHKLTEGNVREIRTLYQTTSHSYLSLSRIYGVAFGTIRDVIKGRSWGWLK